jgi:hypothetical protein
VALRPIHGFATAISKAFFRQSQMTLTPPKGRGFQRPIKNPLYYILNRTISPFSIIIRWSVFPKTQLGEIGFDKGF